MILQFFALVTTTPEWKKLVPVLKVVPSIRWDVVWALLTPPRALAVINPPLNVHRALSVPVLKVCDVSDGTIRIFFHSGYMMYADDSYQLEPE